MIRLLHTSDWHLGRSLYGRPLLEEQRHFLGWLTRLAAEERVDAVLVAGDVYDRAVPPVDAVAVLDEALAGFAHAGIPVVISSGNHDSAVRLGFGASLAEAAQIHLRTRPGEVADPVLFGDVGVYAVPYLLPDAMVEEWGCARSHTGALSTAVERVKADAAARGLARTVMLAHAFVTGASTTDSERDISVGGIGDVPASVFNGIDYVALGHLHGAQRVSERIRYSGSPLPFSFSERHQRKSVSLVTLTRDGRVDVDLVATPVARPMHELVGRLDELLALRPGPPEEAWLRVVLTDPQRPAAPMERLQERWPHTLVLEHRPEVEPVPAQADLARLRGTSDPVEVCALFVEWVDSTYPDRLQRDALADAVEAVRRTELSA